MKYFVLFSAHCLIILIHHVAESSCNSLENELKYEILNSNGQISGKCRSELSELVKSLENPKEDWGIRIIDSTSKIRSGFEVLSDDIGQFDECRAASNVDGSIFGKYCLGNIHLKKDSKHEYSLLKNLKDKTKQLTQKSTSLTDLSLTFAGCLTNSCEADDFATIFNSIFDRITNELAINFTETSCSTKDDDSELTTGAILTIIFLGAVVAIMLAETCYDIVCKLNGVEPKLLFIAFSVYTNSSKLFKITPNRDQLECLNGLKFYSMLWVVIGHTYALAIESPLNNNIDLMGWADSLHSMLVVSGTLAVDTFFVIGGLLISYLYMKSMKSGAKFNVLIYYLHRYIRLTPALGVLALVTATLYSSLGSGPNWDSVRVNQELCRESWWSTLLYVQNYVSVPKLCVGHSWYLSVDMQLYLISPMILFCLRKYSKISIGAMIVAILAISVANFVVAWNEEYPAILTNYYKDYTEYSSNFYIKTHVRAGAWLLGIIFGYLIFEIKQTKIHFKPSKLIRYFLWALSIFSLFFCVFVGHKYLRTPDFSRWGNSLHIALVRDLWSLGICWIITASTLGYGGVINWFLSFPIYQVFNRFTYSIYLIHYMYITVVFASSRAPIYFSDFIMSYYFWGNICFTCLISYFWVLAFESPAIILEKILLETIMKTRSKSKIPT